MTRKHGIRAPRIPRDERPAVTLASQAKQIKTLIDRCSQLEAERHEANMQALQVYADRKEMSRKLDTSKDEIERQNEVIQRLNGYQDCAREIFELLVHPKA